MEMKTDKRKFVTFFVEDKAGAAYENTTGWMILFGGFHF